MGSVKAVPITNLALTSESSPSIDLTASVWWLVVELRSHTQHQPITARPDSLCLRSGPLIGREECGTGSFCRIFYQNIEMGTAMLGPLSSASEVMKQGSLRGWWWNSELWVSDIGAWGICQPLVVIKTRVPIKYSHNTWWSSSQL